MNRGDYTSEIMDFIWFLNENKITGKILDCGAGGRHPKLGVLAKHGFTDLFGVDISESSLQAAQKFAKKNNYQLNLQKANMKSIPFPDDTFSAVFSYNTIFHMTKAGIKKGVDEIIRVLKPGGIGFINFIDIDDDIHRTATEEAPGEFVEWYGKEKVLHTLLTQEECEKMLEGVTLLEKQHKFIHRLETESQYKYGLNDYFFKKE